MRLGPAINWSRQFTAIVHSSSRVCSVPKKIVDGELVPLVDIVDFDLAEGDCGVTLAINTVLHLPELLHLLFTKLVSHEVQQSEFADPVQYRVHHLCVQRGCQEEHQGCHLLLLALDFHLLFLLSNVPDSVFDLLLVVVCSHLVLEGQCARIGSLLRPRLQY